MAKNCDYRFRSQSSLLRSYPVDFGSSDAKFELPTWSRKQHTTLGSCRKKIYKAKFELPTWSNKKHRRLRNRRKIRKGVLFSSSSCLSELGSIANGVEVSTEASVTDFFADVHEEELGSCSSCLPDPGSIPDGFGYLYMEASVLMDFFADVPEE